MRETKSGIEKRTSILKVLKQNKKGLTLGDISEKAGLPGPNVHAHLEILVKNKAAKF